MQRYPINSPVMNLHKHGVFTPTDICLPFEETLGRTLCVNVCTSEQVSVWSVDVWTGLLLFLMSSLVCHFIQLMCGLVGMPRCRNIYTFAAILYKTYCTNKLPRQQLWIAPRLSRDVSPEQRIIMSHSEVYWSFWPSLWFPFSSPDRRKCNNVARDVNFHAIASCCHKA